MLNKADSENNVILEMQYVGNIVLNVTIRKFIDGLWLYFLQDSNEAGLISALETCTDFLQLYLIKKTWYGMLDQFLRHH